MQCGCVEETNPWGPLGCHKKKLRFIGLLGEVRDDFSQKVECHRHRAGGCWQLGVWGIQALFQALNCKRVVGSDKLLLSFNTLLEAGTAQPALSLELSVSGSEHFECCALRGLWPYTFDMLWGRISRLKGMLLLQTSTDARRDTPSS